MYNRTVFISFLFLLSHAIRGQTPNWSETVAKIVYTNCSPCHRSGGSGPFSLMSYGQAFNNRFSMRAAVSQKIMPPWPPEDSYSALAHSRALKEADIDAIVRWVDGGAPSGNLSTAPPPPQYDNLGFIKNPQLVISTPEYTLPGNVDEYRCYPDSSRIGKDMWLTALECIPGNPGIVHHILIFRDGGNRSFQLDQQQTGPGYVCFGGAGTSGAELIGAWVPGAQPFILPRGFGIRLPANSNIIIQVHYPGGSKGKSDKTTVKFQLTDQPQRDTYLVPALNHSTSMTNGPLFIPANAKKTFNQQFFLPFNASVIGVAPHMHLIGTSIRTWAIGPDQKELPMIHIPKWDFHWQGIYQFQKVMKVPAGSMIYSEATYDNTAANHHNPNSPPKDVSVGEATTDEMMITYFLFTLYQTGDETIIIDSAKALVSSAQETKIESRPATLFPNPAGNRSGSQLVFKTDIHDRVDLSLLDLAGREIFRKNYVYAVAGTQVLDLKTDGLGPGTYIIRIRGQKWQATKKWILTSD